MSRAYVPPLKRALHQPAIKALMFVQMITVLVFVGVLPKWFIGLFFIVIYWRLRVLKGALQKPPLTIVLLFMSIGTIAIMFSGLNYYSLDSAVAFCLLGYLLKSLEVLRRRDGVFQIYLGYFLAGVYLLYRFDPIGALLAIALLYFNTLALQAVTAESHFRLNNAVKSSNVLVGFAVPVMIIGFLFFPRLPPLWSIPNDERGGKTGMSDEITPGSVSDLAQSRDPVFRVSFAGELPPRDQWYWRGNTLTEFNGSSWRARYTARNKFSWPRQSQLPLSAETTYSYSVILEKTGRQWLYFLDWPVVINAANSVILPDARAARSENINSNFKYTAVSSPSVEWRNESDHLYENLQLPLAGNEALRQWAIENKSQYAQDVNFIQYLLQYIRSESFFYTLKPPLYSGNQSLADFWLSGRRGFCAHYASAMTYILRAAGIPARMVGGYLGGTYNESGNYIQVRQMEAHVWVEAWVGNRWVRVDPTAAVAPNRVEMNLDALFAQSQPGELPLSSRVTQIRFLNSLTMYWDSAIYRWQVFVLNYDRNLGIGWFESRFGDYSPLKFILLFFLFISILVFVIGFSLGMINLPKRLDEPYRSLRLIEKKCGARHKKETIRQYFERLSVQYPNVFGFNELALVVERMLYEVSQNKKTQTNELHALSRALLKRVK